MSDPMRPSALTGSVPETGQRPARDAFTDAAPLAQPAHTRETLPWWLALAFAVPLIGCGEQVVGWPRADETRPLVIATTPLNDETGTLTTAPITVTFSEAMSPGSLTTATFVVRNGATAIPGTVSYAGVTAIFSPTEGLVADATYEATVTTGASDLVGNTLADDYVWHFSTVSSADETRPRVTSTTPEDGATGVALNVPATATFSERMDPATIGAASFTVKRGTDAITGAVQLVGITAVFVPDVPFAGQTVYTATIASSASDLAGNTLAADHTWSFTTGDFLDDEAPFVTNTRPAGGATNVAVNAAIAATFSEGMDPATISGATVELRRGANLVSGTVDYVGVTAIFTPDATLAAGAVYTATIKAAATDLAGNPMAADHEWTFTTGTDEDTSAPFVTNTTPADESGSIALNAPITATFSEPMAPLSISSATVLLSSGAGSVSGSVTYVGVTAVFTPSGLLLPATTYTATVDASVTDLAGNAMAADYVWTFTTGAFLDTTAPFVIATTPTPGSVDNALNAPVTATFSEPMNPATITGITVTLANGVAPVAGSVSFVGVTAVFTPSGPLLAATTYTATIDSGVTDLAGNPMAADHVWTFTTGAFLDTTAPFVIATTPTPGSVDNALNAPVTATFSEPMNPATITGITVTLANGVAPVAGSVMFVGVTAVFTPAGPLLPATTYIASIDSTVTDLAGNAMAADHVWTFTTGAFLDTTRPVVSSTTPLPGSANNALNAPVTATFSEPMAPATITTITVTLAGGVVPVAGSVMLVGVTAVFTPAAPLLPATTYTATIESTVTDLAGNTMAADHVWTFTTGAFLDTIRPVVSSTTPLPGSIGNALNAPVTATFSEPMAPATITTITVTLAGGVVPVAGSVMLVGVTAVFTPAAPLLPATTYTATIESTVTDLAGNSMVADHVWTFTTGAFLDTIRPTVVDTTPNDGTLDAPINTPITATFSEAMDPLTVNPITMVLEDGLGPITGTVILVGVTAVFTPDEDLAPSTTYTGTIMAGVKDLAGNTMVADYVWTFTTGVFVDSAPPYVLATVPMDGAIAVSVKSTVEAIFSEEMNPLTITGATFTVTLNGLPVLGNVDYAGVTARFTPTVRLSPNTVYVATITTLATDLAGNPLEANEVWTFMTGESPDEIAPSVTFTVPKDDASNVAIDSQVAAVFSEAMDELTINTTSFSVQQLGTVVPAVVSYSGVTATFSPLLPLAPNTVYSAVITTIATDLAGNALAGNYVWNFKTGAVLDATAPFVILTSPQDGDIDVLLDTRVSATFSEVMDPLTLNTLSFLIDDGLNPLDGIVTAVGSTVVFEPSAPLLPNTLYTATITTEATDLTGNPIEADYVWTFTTGALLDTLAPNVIFTNPEDLETNVPTDTSVHATFSDDMDPLTISTASFKVSGPELHEIMGTVVYDVLTRIATFEPSIELQPDTEYTATITMEASDLSGTSLLQDYVWTFSTGQLVAAGPFGLDLGSLTTFVAVAGAGLTNSNSSGITVLNGDVGLSPTATCLGDGSPCSAINPVINGTLYANDPGGIAAKAKVDLTAAYVEGFSLPPGTTVNDISGLTLAPGVYTSGSTMSIAVGGTVTLDGQGDSNAVWVFQIGSSLTVNNNAKVLLVNGAKAGNVFWVAFASSTLGANVEFAGNVLAGASNSVGTDSRVLGRLLCITGQITLLSNNITLPTP